MVSPDSGQTCSGQTWRVPGKHGGPIAPPPFGGGARMGCHKQDVTIWNVDPAGDRDALTPAASGRRGSSPTRPISSGPLPRSCRRVRTSDIQRSADRRRRKDRVRCGTASCGPDTSGNAADRAAAAMVRNDNENWACDAPHFHGGSTTLSVTDGCRWDAVMENTRCSLLSRVDKNRFRASTQIVAPLSRSNAPSQSGSDSSD